MNQFRVLALTVVLAGAGSSSFAAGPSATQQAEWNLSGKLRGSANLRCEDPAPAPENPVEQAIPNPIATPKWVAKARFSPKGTFQYWEIDSRLQQQPLTKWANYNGNWTQTGDKVSLKLDAKSSAALYTSYSGGTKCGTSNPCYNKQRYRFAGTFKHAQGNIARLSLKQTVVFGVTNIVAPGAYSCHGEWKYLKRFHGN